MVDRKGFDREKFIEQLKKNQELLEFVQSLKKEEIQRLKDMRKFETLKPKTSRFNVALLCDPLRQEFNKHRLTLMKRLNSIQEITNNINRLQFQKLSGNITEELKSGVVMNYDELLSLIRHNTWVRDGEFNAIRLILGDINGLIGHIDYVKKVIVTEDEFNSIVHDTQLELSKHNYDLFKELE